MPAARLEELVKLITVYQ